VTKKKRKNTNKRYKQKMLGHWWLTLVILATWEAEIGKIVVRGQPRQIIHKTPFLKQPEQNGVEVWLKQ
jgi:hypothetical protein